MEKLNVLEVLGSVQRALLEKVTPNLRAVCVDIHDNRVELEFFYDENPTEEEQELASIAETEVIADYPSPDYKTVATIKSFPYPKAIPISGFCTYYRYEPTSGYFRKEKSSISKDYK